MSKKEKAIIMSVSILPSTVEKGKQLCDEILGNENFSGLVTYLINKAEKEIKRLSENKPF